MTTSDDERQLRGEGCGLENNDGLIWHMFAPFKNLAIDFKRALQDHVSPVSKVGNKSWFWSGRSRKSVLKINSTARGLYVLWSCGF